MARDDLIRLEGRVSESKGQGNYFVVLDTGQSVAARLCGKMRRFSIKIVVGDKVTVALSPYDLTHGLIMIRH